MCDCSASISEINKEIRKIAVIEDNVRLKILSGDYVFIWCNVCRNQYEPPGIRICSLCEKGVCIRCDPNTDLYNWYPLDDDSVINLERLFN